MSAMWIPPRPTYHLRVFLISLLVVVLCLGGFLFGVRMEAKIPATGIITARDLQELRAPLAGLVEPGWYEGEVIRPSGIARVRLDARGNGRSDPSAGPVQLVHAHELGEDGRRYAVQGLRFHPLQAGDLLWPGQVLATLRVDELQTRLNSVEDQLKELESRGERHDALARERDRLRERLANAVVQVPERGEAWMAVRVRASPSQAVQPGDSVATVVPIDPQTRQPLDLMVRLEVEEKHWGQLWGEPGGDQAVRILSNVYSERTHVPAEGHIERLEPWGESGSTDERRFHALARITKAPHPLPLGSSCKAEIVVGRKLVYRIILEH